MTEAIASLDGSSVAWKPLPKQSVALWCPAFELLYGGSKGGAKTNYLVACVLPILKRAQEKFEATGRRQHKCRIMVFRRNLEDLKDFIAKTHEIYPVFDGQANYHVNDKTWTFSSGATVAMRHLDGPLDHLGYNGNEFVALLFDEVQFISYEAYSFLVAQVRSSDEDYRKLLMVRCTANPGGPHGDWVRRHFSIDEHPAGGKVLRTKTKLPDGREIETTRAFVRSYLKDNPYLDPDGTYEARLRATMSPDEVKQYMDGDFNVVAGAFFSHLIRPQVHFVKSFPIPATWDMIFGIDWGSSAPACALWGARDPDGRVYIVDELHTPGVTGRIFGEKMAEKYRPNLQRWSSERIYKIDDFWGVIDKQAMDRYGSDATAAAGIMEWGFRIFPADKLPGERKVGINQMKERLLLDRHQKPLMVVFEDRAPNVVRSLKGISSCAPEDPEDYDPKSPLAHALDALRFVLMKWPLQKHAEVNPIDAEVERWNRILRRPSRDDGDNRVTGGYGD